MLFLLRSTVNAKQEKTTVSNDKKVFTALVETDPADPENLILIFPDELLESVGWVLGDTLSWTDNKDGSWMLKKKEANEL